MITTIYRQSPQKTEKIIINSWHQLLWEWVNDNYADSEMLLGIIGEAVDEETLKRIMLEINPEILNID